MTADTAASLYPRLEPLLAQVNKPVQYIGGEVNSIVQGLRRRRGPLGTDVPRRLRGGAAQPGACDPLRDPQRARLADGRAHLLDLARPGRPDARGTACRSSRWRTTCRCVRSTCWGSASPPNWATPTCSKHSTWPESRCTVATVASDDPIVIAGGHAAFNPEPIADFIDAAVLGDGEEAALMVSDLVRSWKTVGTTRWTTRPAAYPRRPRRRVRAGVLRRRLRRRRRDRVRVSQRRGRPGQSGQAHADGTRRVALPGASGRAARRDGA